MTSLQVEQVLDWTVCISAIYFYPCFIISSRPGISQQSSLAGNTISGSLFRFGQLGSLFPYLISLANPCIRRALVPLSNIAGSLVSDRPIHSTMCAHGRAIPFTSIQIGDPIILMIVDAGKTLSQAAAQRASGLSPP